MKNIDKTQVGLRIKYIRELHDLTQLELGKMLGVSVGAVNNWEMGRNLPSRMNLEILAELGNKDVDFILYGNQSKFTDDQLGVFKELRAYYEAETDNDSPYSISFALSMYLDHPDGRNMTDKESAEVIREFLNAVLEEEE